MTEMTKAIKENMGNMKTRSYQIYICMSMISKR